MPNVFLPVPEPEMGVERPVVFDVVRKVMKETGIPDDTRISFPGNREVSLHAGTAMKDGHRGDVRMPGRSKVSITVDERTIEDRLLSTATVHPEHLFIFKDTVLGIDLRPIMSPTEVSVNFEFRAEDSVLADRWLAECKTRISAGRDVFLHQLEYNYMIPLEFLHILKELHRLRENVEPYGDSWEKYWDDHRSNRLTQITNQAGLQARWVVPETQIRVQGVFDWSAQPEKGGREDDIQTWKISFTYKFWYDKPAAVRMSYPIMVHNQVVGSKFRPGPDVSPPPEIERIPRTASMSTARLDYFEANREAQIFKSVNGFQVPDFDEWLPAQVPHNTLRIWSCLMQFDPSQPNFLLNLADDLPLDDNYTMKFDADVLEFLRSEWQFIGKTYASVFALTLYRGPNMLPDDRITVDQDLNVFTTQTPSLRDQYHLRLSVIHDFAIISKDALVRLGQNPVAATKIIEMISPSVPLPPIIGDTRTPVKDRYIPPKELLKTSDQMNNNGRGNKEIYQWNTVQLITVEAYKDASRT